MIVGLDISYSSTGVCVILEDRPGHGQLGTWRLIPKGDDRRERFADLFQQFNDLWNKIETPDLIVVEEPFITAYGDMMGKLLGAHGMFLASLGLAHPPIESPILYIHPTTLKKLVTGDGHASKGDIKEMIERLTRLSLQHDEADATALARIGARVNDITTIVDSETNYRDIRFDELEDGILQVFGMSLEGLTKARREKAAAYERGRRRRKREEKRNLGGQHGS